MQTRLVLAKSDVYFSFNEYKNFLVLRYSLKTIQVNKTKETNVTIILTMET